MSYQESRREFVKKAAYVTPVILTMKAQASYAGFGSTGPERGEHCKGHGRKKRRSRGSGKGKRKPRSIKNLFGFING